MGKTVKAQRTEFTLNNEEYRMDKYETKTILVFKKIDGVYDFVSAKHVVMLKLNEMDPQTYPLEKTKKSNTRYLGAVLTKLLNKTKAL